jgi:ABC-2 type transport system ATP-binding protein
MQITAEHLTKTFGQHTALAELTLTFGSGMHGLLGANGAGKTTLMRILAGITNPTSGYVLADGRSLADRAARTAYQRTLGYLPQEPGLYPDLTCIQTLDYTAAVKGLRDKAARREHIADILDKVGLTDRANRRVKTLSGGMRRRLGMAQALLADPRLLIIDEPTAGLDPRERSRLRDLLAGLAATGRTVLLSTHLVEDIASGCPGVTILDRGRLIYHGPTQALIGSVSGYVWTFAADSPSVPPGLCIVSSVATADGTRYRVVAEQSPAAGAQPVSPTLEDAYLALLHAGRLPQQGARR